MRFNPKLLYLPESVYLNATFSFGIHFAACSLIGSWGSIVDLSRVMLDFVRDLGADPQGCVVIRTDIRAVPQYSVLAGTSSYTIEMDDVN